MEKKNCKKNNFYLYLVYSMVSPVLYSLCTLLLPDIFHVM